MKTFLETAKGYAPWLAVLALVAYMEYHGPRSVQPAADPAVAVATDPTIVDLGRAYRKADAAAPPAGIIRCASWEGSGGLVPDRPDAPKPTEPDATGSGPFRARRPILDDDVADPADADPAPAAPAQYQLADAWGQVWTSPDPAWLRKFVAGRNASGGYAAPAAAPAVCGPGGCPAPATRGRSFGRR